MSEYPPDDGSPSPQHGRETPQHNVSFEDAPNAANNSIIGKVRSRVSSILPNRLSRWFSPSAKSQNDSPNGSLSGVNTTLPARRRRRLEVEEEDNYDDEIQQPGEYEDNNRIRSGQEENSEEDDEDEEDDEESEEEYNAIGGMTKQERRDLNVDRHPPAKRSRLNMDVRDSPLITRRQPLLSSTPAVGSAYLRNSSATASAVAPRSSYQRYTNLNLYAHQSKKEPAFNFGGQQRETTTTTTKMNTDIIDLISNAANETEEDKRLQDNVYSVRTGISSRKSLNIPSSSSTLRGAENVYATVSQLKRQPLSSAKTELSTSLSTGLTPRRTSTTIHEVKDFEQQQQQYAEKQDVVDESNTNSAYNGRRLYETNNNRTNKRQKLINGSLNLNATAIPQSNEAILIDSASESGESTTDVIKSNPSNIPQHQRKTGLFNMSATGTAGNTRNSSRTSSFGNGLNFYSHLEGRKSLFTGQNHGISNPLNNSTLSLTSLNRRQFNASIYGSTSALSDSRLLNTFSPFYKGKTTYGGAAAYNKYTAGAGASAVRITPTLIRPTSSLSTLSSSNNSLATNVISQQVGDNSTISSTAKRILDLINDFATPLSEAKKMASNLKTNPNLHIPPQGKGRLNESDLNASRAMRLSQVRTPYSRPAVILQPSGNANGRGMMGGPLPPVKELQVPTMSQLLQMKKLQNTTEKARKITTTENTRNAVSNTGITEYTLPEVRTNKVSEKKEPLQRHTNKIKNKVTNSLRTSNASKDIKDEEPPPPVNLPNIAFPLMQSVPVIDIKLNKTTVVSSNTPGTFESTLTSTKTESTKTEANKMTAFAFNTKPITPSPTQTTTPITDCKIKQALNKSPFITPPVSTLTKTINTFEFSEPLQVKGLPRPPTDDNITTTKLINYKFSLPLDVTPITAQKQQNTPQQPQLKTGSCLDALSRPFSLPITSQTTTTTDATTPQATGASGFGNRFKISSNEWECDACMIRNKADINKCLACETPRKQTMPTDQSNPNNSSQLTPLTSTFGHQFKKSSTEWECDTCMIRNKQESKKCVACETPCKGAAATSSTSTLLTPIKNSFGDAFKPKSGTWECQTCMITNKNEVNECVACQTKKPGAVNNTGSNTNTSAAPATQFKFGFAAAGVNNTTATTTSADAGFKTLAAQQKVSKWECDACMTRNDATRTKCACCEQPKPGTANMEAASLAENKFTFGATAAAKFSFGFGPAANAPKEEDLKQELNKTEEKKSSLGFAATTTSSTSGGFQFGIKPIAKTESKKDETDYNITSTAGFKFGVLSDAVAKTDTPVTPAITGFVFGSKPVPQTTASTTASSTTTTNTTAVNSPSVKFSLTTTATTSSNDKPTGVAAPTYSFGTNTAASSTTGGFELGCNKTETKPVLVTEEKKSSDSFAFKTPAAVSTTTAQCSGFMFGSPTTNKSSTTTAVSSSNYTATTASSATTAAVKPMFSFGSPSATPIAATPIAVAPVATPAFGGFNFGSNTTTTTDSTPTTGNTLIGAVTSTSAKTTTARITCLSTTATTTPASTNIFGSFGGGGGGGGGLTNTASATPTFGSSPSYPANNSTTVSSSTNSKTSNTTQFGAFGAKAATTSNVFGSFGAGSGSGTKTTETKPTLPVFGNVASSSTSQSSSNSSSYVFGSSNAGNTSTAPALGATGSTTTPGSVTSTSATWPKNSFVFGTSAASTTSVISAAAIGNENKEATKPSVFGTCSTSNANSTNQQQTASIFGASSASNTTAPAPAFGTVAAGTSNSNSNLFGTNSAPAATNIFGANSSGTAATPAPAFGSSPFGGSASSTSSTPTFGSTAASGANTTFGGFGAAAASNTKTNSTVEVKKPEAAFNFGAAPATQSTSGGFNFGSSLSTTKPAFNFGGSATVQQPTFNFTGSTTESQNSTKPFQFGATPSAPVFNFSRGALESTPNAPFQFNAGAAPVSSNIFAPAPTPGAQTAQQAKRKIRAPIRRVTQR